MKLTDPLGQKFGTVFSFVTVIVVTGWVAIKVMEAYSLIFLGQPVHFDQNLDNAVIGLLLGYFGFRKNQNAQIAEKIGAELRNLTDDESTRKTPEVGG